MMKNICLCENILLVRILAIDNLVPQHQATNIFNTDSLKMADSSSDKCISQW